MSPNIWPFNVGIKKAAQEAGVRDLGVIEHWIDPESSTGYSRAACGLCTGWLRAGKSLDAFTAVFPDGSKKEIT